MTLSSALRRLLVELQTWCSADCCKGRAFSVSAAAVGRWLDGERIDRAREMAEEIARVGAGLSEAEERVALAARGLESGWAGAEFRAFWERFAQAFAAVVAARRGADAVPGTFVDDRRLPE